MRSIILKEEELYAGTIFKEQNIDIAVKTDTKKKLQGTK
jgi:hypothetical protein